MFRPGLALFSLIFIVFPFVVAIGFDLASGNGYVFFTLSISLVSSVTIFGVAALTIVLAWIGWHWFRLWRL